MSSVVNPVRAACVAALVLGTLAAGPAAQEKYWPYWRGPAADGMAAGDAPVQWSDTQNIKWRTEIPGLGNSSPVVWGDRIFLTTAIKTGGSAPAASASAPAAGANPHGESGPLVEHTFDVLCLDRKTGKILWQRTARRAVPHEGGHNTYGSFASNSPVTDGTFVYAFFGSRGMYCYDMDGKLIWEKDYGIQLRMKMGFGEGMAPVVYGNKVILVFDHEGDSFMAVLDKTTGKEIWRVSRPEKTNWAAPLVVEFKGRTEVVVAGSAKVRSYDLETGKTIWECAGLGANTIPQPVRQDDMVFVMTGYRNPNLMAIRLGREGDLTGTDAVVSCYNARTGEPYYHQVRLPKAYSFKSSPVGVNSKLYLASENEDVIVLRMGEKFEVLATNTMKDQVFIATPAITGGEIFLRSKTSLFCIRAN